MKFRVNSKKDKNSLVARRDYGGVFINSSFYKDGTVLTSDALKAIGCSDAIKERYLVRVREKTKK